MAYFAKLSSNNEVITVISVSNNDIQNLPFPESEPVGVAYIHSIFGEEPGFTWKQTSYNNNFRKRYAMIGGVYDADNDGFIPLGPEFTSWSFNKDKWLWEAPVPYPAGTSNFYIWDEPTLSWALVPNE
jgi:hypothetical protein